MRTTRAAAGVLLSGIVVLGAAGCGGGDDEAAVQAEGGRAEEAPAPAAEAAPGAGATAAYPAERAVRWLDALTDVGIERDDGLAPTDYEGRLASGQTLIAGDVVGTPTIVQRELALPGTTFGGTDEGGQNGEPVEMPVEDVLVLRLRPTAGPGGRPTPAREYALEVRLGVPRPGVDHAETVLPLAPPAGTGLMFVGSVEGTVADGTLGTGIVVRTGDGRLAAGGPGVADRTAVDGTATFSQLATELTTLAAD